MATHATLTAFSQGSDAAFQLWIQELEAALVATGLTVTADTGQINPMTVVRPAINTMAGYRIYKTNDGLADLYIKLEFGCYNTVSRPAIAYTVGTSTNGAGTITGVTSTRNLFSMSDPVSAAPTQTRAAGRTGVYWVTFKLGTYTNAPVFSLALMRFANTNGVPNSNGFTVYATHGSAGAAAPAAQQVDIANVSVSGIGFAHCLTPAGVVTGTAGTNIQFWKHYTAQPQTICNPFALTYDTATVAFGQQRTLTPMPGATMNFIATGIGWKRCALGSVADAHSLMLPWE